jgi:predicted nucleic acid-binding protein
MRVYVDTSVIGGCLDDKFGEESRALIEMAVQGEIRLLLSDLLADELLPAPLAVQEILAMVPAQHVEVIETTRQVDRLRDEYIKAGAAGPRQANDALHIALATVWRADLLVSWNFKHIVHLNKIRLFNAVNLREGYTVLEIRSPREVI